MKKISHPFKSLLAAAVLLSLCLSGCGNASSVNAKSENSFTPNLDTEKETTLEIAGFMANFEALDQVVMNFNEIYPNVTISYEQNSSYMLADYLDNNQVVDIIMTSTGNLEPTAAPENYVGNKVLDLSKEDIDFDEIQPSLLSCCKVDGALLRVPFLQNVCGMAVNKTLLEKEGLSVPTNYEEFLTVLESLKQKGYTPIQGSELHVYSELVSNMAMYNMSANEDLLPVLERLQTIIDNGYTDYDLNASYPNDNYDQAILSFFEGNVPFWVCNTESFSGAKKRESKSETFSKEPFDYAFIYAPIGDSGAYECVEPWYGFSIPENADNKDYAVEFIRFLSTTDQLNTMAAIKGMPSAAKEAVNERYPDLHKEGTIQASFENDGSVSPLLQEAFNTVCADFGAGKYTSAEEALQAFNDAKAAINQ